ncbi:MAG: hypothetical protein JNM96_07195 [Bacteroidia bacterium]|nr:hypothetical protein [Bacteroidia bacterium]
MLNKDINLLEELDSISKVHLLNRHDVDQIMIDFATRILPALKIERINVWLFNPEKTALISIGEYDLRTKKFSKNSILDQWMYPVYFEGLKENKIILAEDIYNHPLTKELSDNYSKPNDIYSLLDIPLRIGGDLIGVICFEKTGVQKTFTENEKSFCFSISFVLASALESRHRRAAQAKLEKLLLEKEMLIKEINHRTKNNLAILISLMRISKNKAGCDEAKRVLDEYEQRIFSMLKIHDLLQQSQNFNKINLAQYLRELINEFRVTFPQINHCINSKINVFQCPLSSKKAIYLGIIITEVLMNTLKHASQNPGFELKFEFTETKEQHFKLTIGDNGPGFNYKESSGKSSLGLSLINDLIENLNIKATLPNSKSSYYIFEIISEE